MVSGRARERGVGRSPGVGLFPAITGTRQLCVKMKLLTNHIKVYKIYYYYNFAPLVKRFKRLGTYESYPNNRATCGR